MKGKVIFHIGKLENTEEDRGEDKRKKTNSGLNRSKSV